MATQKSAKSASKKAAAAKKTPRKVVPKKAPAKKPSTKKTPTKKAPAKKVGAGARAAAKAVVKKRSASAVTPKRGPRAKQAPTAAGSASSRLRIRMYRHGLGDCLLLLFRKNDGTTASMLIDCGLISVATGGTDTVKKVVTDIKATTGGHIDVVAMTHEHWDHASGFTQAKELFDGITVGQAWYAWTEDPGHPLSNKLRRDREQKVKALTLAVSVMTKTPALAERAAGLEAILGFFGLNAADALAASRPGAATPIGKTRAAFEYLKNRVEVPKRFLRPGQAPLALPGVEGVRIYVLGPPESETLIRRSAPTKKGREVYEFSQDLGVATSLAAAFERMAGSGNSGAFDDCPFDSTYREARRSHDAKQLVAELWDDPKHAWRRIDHDWTQAAETLAIDLDNHTNNSCLVLAVEFTDTKEVCLFPADAQVGNWLSWQDLKWKLPDGETTGPNLLERTVFYKVGHHGSHNATLRAQGLEQMTSEKLVAFIPVFVEQAVKNRWMAMPFPPLVERLKEKTRGRLLKSDEPAPAGAKAGRLIETALFFELAL